MSVTSHASKQSYPRESAFYGLAMQLIIIVFNHCMQYMQKQSSLRYWLDDVKYNGGVMRVSDLCPLCTSTSTLYGYRSLL